MYKTITRNRFNKNKLNRPRKVKFEKLLGRLLVLISFIFLFSLLVTFIINNIGLASFDSGSNKKEIETVIVQDGDTLWSISEDYLSGGMDPRKYVYKIREFNNLDDIMLRSGQEIKIPFEDKKKD